MDFSLPAFLPLWFMAWQLEMCTGSSCTSQLPSQSLPRGHHVAFAPLSSGHRQALTRWCYKRNSGGPAPGTLHLFSPKKKALPVLHTSFWSSMRSSCQLPVLSRWMTTACCFLVPPKLFDFFLWLFYRREAFTRLTAFLASPCFA